MEEGLDTLCIWCIWTVYGQELLDNAINLPSFHEDFKEFCYFGQELLDILFL